MKDIIISGPTAAGKDEIIKILHNELEKEYPGKVSVGRYYTTRKDERYPGERDEYFITEDQYDEMLAKGEILFGDNNSEYRVGYSVHEFAKNEIVLVNIAAKFVEPLKEYLSEHEGKAWAAFVTAPREDRVERIRFREQMVIYEPAEFKVDNDVSTDAEYEKHKEAFDFHVENKEGKLDETMTELRPRIQEFLKS